MQLSTRLLTTTITSTSRRLCKHPTSKLPSTTSVNSKISASFLTSIWLLRVAESSKATSRSTSLKLMQVIWPSRYRRCIRMLVVSTPSNILMSSSTSDSIKIQQRWHFASKSITLNTSSNTPSRLTYKTTCSTIWVWCSGIGSLSELTLGASSP